MQRKNARIEEFLAAEEQKHRERGGERLARVYGRALASVRRYPPEIRSSEDARCLEGVGEYLAAQIGALLLSQQQQQQQPNKPKASLLKTSAAPVVIPRGRRPTFPLFSAKTKKTKAREALLLLRQQRRQSSIRGQSASTRRGRGRVATRCLLRSIAQG